MAHRDSIQVLQRTQFLAREFVASFCERLPTSLADFPPQAILLVRRAHERPQHPAEAVADRLVAGKEEGLRRNEGAVSGRLSTQSGPTLQAQLTVN